jgi:hypothetical protein
VRSPAFPCRRSSRPIERLAGIITEDDLIRHVSQAGFGLDLLPGNERLAGLDASAGMAGGGGVGEVLKQLRQLVW